MPFLIDKIKQKNNLSFKLMDAADVEMPNGKSVAEAFEEMGGNAVQNLYGTTADTLPLAVANAVKEGKTYFIEHTDATYGKMIFSNFAYSESMDIVVASTYLNTGFGVFSIAVIGSVRDEAWEFIIEQLAEKEDIPKPVIAVDLSKYESEGKIVETYDDASSLTYNFEFDSEGNPVKITDSSGRETVITW